MTSHLETHYLDQQMRKALQSMAESSWGLALHHFERAYREALWLCQYCVDNAQYEPAQKAYQLLQESARGYISCTDSPDTVYAIEEDMRLIKRELRSQFGSRFYPPEREAPNH